MSAVAWGALVSLVVIGVDSLNRTHGWARAGVAWLALSIFFVWLVVDKRGA